MCGGHSEPVGTAAAQVPQLICLPPHLGCELLEGREMVPWLQAGIKCWGSDVVGTSQSPACTVPTSLIPLLTLPLAHTVHLSVGACVAGKDQRARAASSFSSL